jgi:DNA-binding transcriptional LysR family regulator
MTAHWRTFCMRANDSFDSNQYALRMLDVRRLQVMVEVVRRGSFTAAADALDFTQPSVSRQIAALEREAGVRLLERDARRVRLTQAGELVFEHAEAILARLAATESALDALADLEGGRLRMASFASANTWLVPEALRRFGDRHPRVELSLTAVPSDRALASLRAGELDLAVLTDWDVPGPDAPEGVRLEPIARDRLLVALAHDHPLAGRPEFRLADLAAETWIEGSHPDCLGPLEQHYRARGIAPRIGFHCDDWTGKQALVAAGVGITLFPELAVGSARKDLVLRPLTDGIASRQTYAAVPAGYQAPAAREMLTLLRELARSSG